MQRSSFTAQGPAALLAQVFAAIGIILVLAITVPVLGIVMVPGVLIAGWMRAHLSGAAPLRRGVARP